MEFNCLKAREPLRGDNLLFTSKSPGVNSTTLIYLKRMKGQYILSLAYIYYDIPFLIHTIYMPCLTKICTAHIYAVLNGH